jgi:predicted DNA-binding transcriptional regulator YafY
MPRNSREPTLARQWELLKLIPRHRPGATARELCERLKNAGHEVTKRTVERDLPELSIVFPLECNDVSMPYGWHWKRDISFDIPGIALAEAVSLGLLEDLLRQLVPPTFVTALEGRFNAASNKLRSMPQNRYTKWTDLVRYVQPGLPFLPPIIQPGVIETVQEALLGRKQLRAVYLSAGAIAAKERVLHPLALIQQGARSYLLAISKDRPGPIQYALHRFQAVELLAEPAKIPKGFSLDEFLAAGGAQFGQGATITLKATVADDLATILRETPISASQSLVSRDGTNTLTATVKDSWQLGFWLLSQGQAITVLKPAALRKRMIAMLTQTLARYEMP